MFSLLDKNALVSINASIQNLDEKGMLDPSALKMILKEHLNETAEVFGNIDYLKKIFNFSLDLLVKKSIISSEEKDHYIKNLEILYSGTDEKLNDSILEGKGSYTAEEKAIMIDASSYKGKFETYESLVLKYPPHKSKHGWSALVWPNPEKVEARQVTYVKPYTFDINEGGWILCQDKTLMPNFQERVDTEIDGRGTGSPLEGDFFVYRKDKERVMPYTRDELDLASSALLHYHVASLISTKTVKDRLVLKTKVDVEDERRQRLGNENLYYRQLSENSYNMTYEEMENIVRQINEDYDQKVEVIYQPDTNGINRPKLFRISESKNGEGNFVEDYDEYGLVRKNMDNFTVDELIKLINKDFNRKMDVSYFDERILEILGETTETTIDKDILVPRSISKKEINKIIKQINDDYLNAIASINKQAYNTVKDNYVNLLTCTADEKTSIKSRLQKAANINVFDTYKAGTDYLENTKRKRIEMPVLNEIFNKINELELEIDVNRDEIFERVNRFNADKTFTDNITIEKTLSVFLDAVFNKNVQIDGDLTVKKRLIVEGDEIYFSKLEAITKVNSVNVVYKDKVLELNKPAEAIGDSSVTYNDWSKKLGNGFVGTSAYRGNNVNPYIFGFEEARGCFVGGYSPSESEVDVRANTFKFAYRDDVLADKKPVRYNITTDRLETTDEVNADLNGSIYKEYIVDATKIDATVGVFTPVRMDTTGKFVKAKSDTLENANMLGIVRKIETQPNSKKLIQVALFGNVQMNISGANVSDVVFLDDAGNLVKAINKNNTESYIIKEVGKVLDSGILFLNPQVAVNYMPLQYRSPEENANYSTEKILIGSYINDATYAYMKPVGIYSNAYEVYAIAKHSINGLAGFMVKNQTGDKILADNGTIVDISSVFPFATTLNDDIYLTASNTLSIEPSSIKVGNIVGVNLMRINIVPERIITPEENEPVIINASVNQKQDLAPGQYYRIVMENDSVDELTLMENGADFNKFYVINNTGKAYLRDIFISKSMGTFYLTNDESLYYKPTIAQKSISKNKLTQIAYVDPASVKAIYNK